MKTVVLLGAMLGFYTTFSVAQTGTARASDTTAIMTALANWERAWQTGDPALAAADYAVDADWTNAFGMRRHGRDSIHALLVEVFQLPFVMEGETNYEYHDLRFLSPTIATLRSLAIRVGQQLPTGEVEEPRRTNHLRVFTKQDGRWEIVSHLIGDERTPGLRR